MITHRLNYGNYFYKLEVCVTHSEVQSIHFPINYYHISGVVPRIDR